MVTRGVYAQSTLSSEAAKHIGHHGAQQAGHLFIMIYMLYLPCRKKCTHGILKRPALHTLFNFLDVLR